MSDYVEPEFVHTRGTFHGRYLTPKDKRPCTSTGPRLLDHLLSVAASDDPEYLRGPGNGEFAVIDVVTKEKAWFEMPHGCTPETVTGMVASCLNATPLRIGNKVWIA